MQEYASLQRKLRPLLLPLAKLCSLGMRMRAFVYAHSALPCFSPPAPTVSLGGPGFGARGGLMLASWLLGWAGARKLSAAVIARPKGGHPHETPHLVDIADQAYETGAEPLLLARYNPSARVVVDKDLIRAGKKAYNLGKPEFYLLYDCFSTLWMRRAIDLVLLNREDVDRGYNLVFPAGTWKEGASCLRRAKALFLFMSPEDLKARQTLVERRLAWLGKPVFGLHMHIWRLRDVASGASAEGIGEEPYLLLTGEGDQDTSAAAVQEFIGRAPRIRLVFTDNHSFTTHDASFVAKEAKRMRCTQVICSPREAVKLGGLNGVNCWTYDPHVVFGKSFFCEQSFQDWWESCWHREFLD